MNTRWKLIVYLLAIFAAGSVSGWMVATKNTTQKTIPRAPRHEDPKDMAERTKAKYRRELKLTDEQAAKVDAIIDDNFAELKVFFEQQRKEMGLIFSNRNERILAVLDPEQQQVFRENEARREREMRDKFRFGRGHGHGGPRDKDGKKCEPNNSRENGTYEKTNPH